MTTKPPYPLPKTRGELRDLLRIGISCEVAEHFAESADITLRGWLEFDEFKVMGPPNGGWVLFVPTGKVAK